MSCERDTVYPESKYYNSLSFTDSSAIHPKNAIYQNIIDNYVDKGAVGISLMIRDEFGTWLGAGGYADIKSGIEMQKGNQFLIASISKTFTASAIYSYIDEGVISFDDPVNKWIDKSITDKIDNANESQIKHLLSHRSGIHDIYTTKMNMDMYNKADNNWSQEKLLEYVYGKKANFTVDKDYSYSNTNYLLLGMILEKASGKTLKEVYQDKIFTPLNLQSAYYGIGDDKAPDGMVKGYEDLYGNGKYIEAQDFYMDEIGVGGDGGIAINAYELGIFLDELTKGNVISEKSLGNMKNWFDIKVYYEGAEHTRNGYGFEYYEKEYGDAYGHQGGISGFSSEMYYFPEQNVTLAILFNFAVATQVNYDEYLNFTEELEKAIFE
jgi:D-alanyl-D-alanine carboxypeptidase